MKELVRIVCKYIKPKARPKIAGRTAKAKERNTLNQRNKARTRTWKGEGKSMARLTGTVLISSV